MRRPVGTPGLCVQTMLGAWLGCQDEVVGKEVGIVATVAPGLVRLVGGVSPQGARHMTNTQPPQLSPARFA